MNLRLGVMGLVVGLHYFALQVPCEQALAAEVPNKRVLAIGIDGLRSDALAAANTPNLDRLIKAGAYTTNTRILGPRYRKNDTISGPGWGSYLTGVWADKHGVHDNKFGGRNFDEYPHFFQRLKSQFPQARTGSFVDWEPIETYIVSGADVHKVYAGRNKQSYTENDAKIAADAATFLREDNPTATMVYFGAVDETGHADGFHPSVPEYIAAIETVDRHIGTLLKAIEARETYQAEDWLVLVSTDHGGKGTGHGKGHDVPEIYTTFLLVSGPSAQPGEIEEQTYVVDLSVTALVHLGVKIDAAWNLDGRAVGLKSADSPTKSRKSHD